MLDFSVDIREEKQTPIIKINGEIDVYNAPRLSEYLKETLESGQVSILVINMENVQYIDSTGLGTVAQIAHTLSQKNGKIHVVCTRPSIKKIFEVSGLIRKNIILFEEESAAIAAII